MVFFNWFFYTVSWLFASSPLYRKGKSCSIFPQGSNYSAMPLTLSNACPFSHSRKNHTAAGNSLCYPTFPFPLLLSAVLFNNQLSFQLYSIFEIRFLLVKKCMNFSFISILADFSHFSWISCLANFSWISSLTDFQFWLI